MVTDTKELLTQSKSCMKDGFFVKQTNNMLDIKINMYIVPLPHAVYLNHLESIVTRLIQGASNPKVYARF